MATQSAVTAGSAALESYVDGVLGFEAYFVTQDVYDQGTTIILNTWDDAGAADNPDAVDLKVAQCGIALYGAISSAGYGDKVTQDQCVAAAGAVLAATGRNPASGQ